ncbi:hypothetical protein IK110_03210 [Candidatus Saccharibacteria bacterium]|nr:hypothetical protein [Candidatus Saccharibacteria bacterium]
MTKDGKISTLDAKAIRAGISRGWSWEEFMAKYDCSKQDLKFRISSLYSKSKKDLKEVLVGIEENGKKNRKPKAKKTTKSSSEAKTELEVAETKAVEAVADLGGLREEEARLSEIVIALENEQKSLVARHRGQIGAMQELGKEIDRIKQAFDDCAAKYKDAMAKTRSVEEDIEKVLATKREAKVKLEDVRRQISDLMRVVVFVYNNGNIEVQEGEMTLDDSGYEVVYEKMRDDVRYETLRVIDIKALAKVICIRANAKKSGSKEVEFLFDNQDLEIIFGQVG